MIGKLRKILIFFLFFAWIFSGWPHIFNFPIKIQNIKAIAPPSIITTSTVPILENTNAHNIITSLISVEPIIPLKVRRLTQDININRDASFECNIAPFRIDISDGVSQTATLTLSVKGRVNLLEIGSLPDGIDVKFIENDDYILSLNNKDKTAIRVSAQSGSENGNFSIPIIYNVDNSIVVCQLNIIKS